MCGEKSDACARLSDCCTTLTGDGAQHKPQCSTKHCTSPLPNGLPHSIDSPSLPPGAGLQAAHFGSDLLCDCSFLIYLHYVYASFTLR